MCNPIMIASMAISGLKYMQEEQMKKGARDSARLSLAVQSEGLVTKNTEQLLALETDEDNFRRQAATSKGELMASSAGRGLATSGATTAALGEHDMRQRDLLMASNNRRSGELLALSTDQSNLNMEWGNRMMQNKSGGLGGALLALGSGAMSGYSTNAMLGDAAPGTFEEMFS